METQLWKNIAMVKEEIINKDRPLGIVISGSVARGDFGSRSDVDLYILMEDEHEKTFKTEVIDGRRFEFTYYPLKTLRKEIMEKTENPRALNVFNEAKILYDPKGIAQELVELAKHRYKTFKYPPDKIQWARYAIICMKDKILDDLENNRETFALYDTYSVVNYVLSGLLYLQNIPNRDYRGNLKLVLNNENFDEHLKLLITKVIRSSSTEKVDASLELCDSFLKLSQ